MSAIKQNQYNIFVGAETGLIKGVQISEEGKSWRNLNAVHEAQRAKQVQVLSWGSDQTQLYAGLRDRSVVTYDWTSGDVVSTVPDSGGEGALRGLATVDGSLVTCTEKGQLCITKDEETKVAAEAGDNISFLRQNPWQRHLVATGGKENDVKIWNLEDTTKPIFKAKNVRNDWLNLRVPVWVGDAAFMPDSEKIVTCTGHHQVRVYDPSTPQKRPVLDVEIDEYPLMSLSLRPNYNQVIVGNTRGVMALVDLRGKGHMVQKYRGFAGAVRSVCCHDNSSVVASCGLDRFLRVHDINSKELLHKVYLKSRLNCLIIADKYTGQSQLLDHIKQEDQSEDQELGQVEADLDLDPETKEVEDIWENMEMVGKKRKIKESRGDCVEENDSGAFSDEGGENSEEEEEEAPKKKSKSGKHKGSKKKKKKKTSG